MTSTLSRRRIVHLNQTVAPLTVPVRSRSKHDQCIVGNHIEQMGVNTSRLDANDDGLPCLAILTLQFPPDQWLVLTVCKVSSERALFLSPF